MWLGLTFCEASIVALLAGQKRGKVFTVKISLNIRVFALWPFVRFVKFLCVRILFV